MPIPTEMRLQAFVRQQISEDRIGMQFSALFVKYMLLVKVCSLSCFGKQNWSDLEQLECSFVDQKDWEANSIKSVTSTVVLVSLDSSLQLGPGLI